MKTTRFILPLLLILICCCARQVEIPDVLQPDEAACAEFFPTGTWYAIHTIEADLPFGKKATIVGVTMGDSVFGKVRVTGMSIEGVTLFDVLSTKSELQILTALPPMDNPAFLRGLVQNIRFLFFTPEGEPADCEWADDIGKTKLILSPDGIWTLTGRNKTDRLVRRATAQAPGQNGFAEQITLEVLYPVAYSLRLSLLDSGPVDSSVDPFSP